MFMLDSVYGTAPLRENLQVFLEFLTQGPGVDFLAVVFRCRVAD